ncbi:MAG: polysaccharide deacetylase family protein [Oligoflexia bacterium]|nr:polysaccharide deacetylase family protein [Oligoflexia bacterium]
MRTRAVLQEKVLAGVTAISIVTGAVVVSRQLSASATPEPVRPEIVALTEPSRPWAQISEDIRETLRQNLAAPMISEWRNSGRLPEELFENLRALAEPAAWQELCERLSALPPEDLAVFENAIERFARDLTCAPALQEKQRAHWDAQRTRLGEPSLRARAARNRVLSAPSARVTVDQLAPGEVALAFAGGPHPALTEETLRILARHGVRANFFQLGRNVRNHPELSRRILEDRHALGSHTFRQLPLARLDLRRAGEDIRAGERSVSGAAGRASLGFLFPPGEETPALETLVQESGITALHASTDSRDWQLRDPKQLAKRALYTLERDRKGILLLDDTRAQSVLALPMLLEGLVERGFTFVVFE